MILFVLAVIWAVIAFFDHGVLEKLDCLISAVFLIGGSICEVIRERC